MNHSPHHTAKTSPSKGVVPPLLKTAPERHPAKSSKAARNPATISSASSNCTKCRHFYVTWEDRHPYGCKRFQVKTTYLPAYHVRRQSGMSCLYYEPKHLFALKSQSSRPSSSHHAPGNQHPETSLKKEREKIGLHLKPSHEAPQPQLFTKKLHKEGEPQQPYLTLNDNPAINKLT